MGLFEHWPYTNFHDLNLNWIVGKVKNIDDNVASAASSAASAAESATASRGSADASAASAESAAGSAESAAGYASDIQESAEQIQLNTERLNNLIIQGTPTEGNAELIDIRVGANGITYPTAGDSVRGQYTELDTKFSVKYSNFEKTINETAMIKYGTITTNVNVGDTVNINQINSNTAWGQIVIPVKAGEWFLLTGTGGDGARLWALLDTDAKLLSKSAASVSLTNYTLTAMQDGYAVFNVLLANTYSLEYHKLIIYDVIDEASYTELNDDWCDGYITTNAPVGTAIPFAYMYSGSYKTQLRRCRTGETYLVTARGGSAPRSWCVIDENYQVLSVGDADTNYEDKVIDITEDGYLIVNALANMPYSLAAKLKKADTKFENAIMPSANEVVESVQYSSSTNLTYSEIISGYDALLAAYPSQITKTSLGLDSSGEYTIYRYDFIPDMPDLYGNNQNIIESYTAAELPVIYMDACIHGGERPCARALLNFMHKVYTSSGNDIFSWLKDHIHFVIIPVVNPYGYVNGVRKNANGVDLNRNFVPFWIKGESSPSSEEYRGANALSEVEAQYVNAILNDIKDKNAMYMSWHTHGNFTAYDKMTCYAFPFFIYGSTNQVIANDLINAITRSGHVNHNLPADSGYIGIMQVANETGMSAYQGAMYGIPSVCPEVMYRYYDGNIGADYSNDVNCMNVEYVLRTTTLMYKYFKN